MPQLKIDPSQLCNGDVSRLLCGRGCIWKFFRKVPGLQRVTDLDLTQCRMPSMSEHISCALRKQGSATLAETLKSESSGRYYQLQRLTTRRYPLPCQEPIYEPLLLYCQFRYNNAKFCVPVRSHVTENGVIRIRSDQKTSGTTFHLVYNLINVQQDATYSVHYIFL